jgi:hypothetical protein
MLAPHLILAAALATSPRLAVLPVAAGEGVPPSTAAAVAEAVAGEVRQRSGVEVITQREIGAVLSLEREQAMLGCQSGSCMAELGGALGCDRLVVGDLARLGESWLFSLKLVETTQARVTAQASRRLRGGTIDDVLDQVPAMVGELFAATAVAAPANRTAPARAGTPTAAAGTPPRPWAAEPIEVAPEVRALLAGWADPAGRLIVTVPYSGLDAPFFWGDGARFFQLRVRGGGQEGKVAFDRAFWDPRARVPAEAMLDVHGDRGLLTCGDKTIPLRYVPPAELAGKLKEARFLAPRWRRIPVALARDDAGTYYFVDGARGPDGAAVRGAPGLQLYAGRKGKLVRLQLDDTLSDGGGQLFISPGGRLEVKRSSTGAVEAAWLTGGARQPLTWLEPADHGRLIYSELGAYGGEPLGTPCDGRL